MQGLIVLRLFTTGAECENEMLNLSAGTSCCLQTTCLFFTGLESCRRCTCCHNNRKTWACI